MISRVLTLTGSAQRLNTALDTNLQGPGENQDQRGRVQLEALAANANPIYVGTKSTTSSTDHGWSIPAPVGSVPAPPYISPENTRIRLSDLYVIGTNTEKIKVTLFDE